jgi:hypothetical protein
VQEGDFSRLLVLDLHQWPCHPRAENSNGPRLRGGCKESPILLRQEDIGIRQ